MHHIYLSRRNLLTLISKLDRKARGESTQCAIVKQDKDHPKYKMTVAPVMVTAVEDADYYLDRPPGGVVAAEQARLDDIAVVRQLLFELETIEGTGVASRAQLISTGLRKLGVL